MVNTGSRSVLNDEFEHEHVQLFRDDASGLVGVIAIHSTALGPAMGGLRIRAYPDVDAAVVDALRLSHAMTLKNAAAGLDLGGGKAVIIDDGTTDRRDDRLRAFADVLDRLGGRYVTAEDVGTTTADMDLIAERTRWVVGRSADHGGLGDPSGSTARTVFGAIERAAALHVDGGTTERAAALHLDAGASRTGATSATPGSLEGLTVGVLGVGKVGGPLAGLLTAAGATVVVTDADPARAAAEAARVGATAVPLDGFVERELDVLAPCALGQLIDVDDVPRLRCRIVAGAANNPLVGRATAVALAERDILYVPDFLANCGGIIQVGAEFLGFGPDELAARVGACADRVEDVLRRARDDGELPVDVAERLALERVRDVAGHAAGA